MKIRVKFGFRYDVNEVLDFSKKEFEEFEKNIPSMCPNVKEILDNEFLEEEGRRASTLSDFSINYEVLE